MNLVFVVLAAALPIRAVAASPAPEIIWSGVEPSTNTKTELVFRDGEATADLSGYFLGKDYGSSESDGSTSSVKTGSYVVVFKDGEKLRWLAKSYFSLTVSSAGRTTEGLWSAAIRFRRSKAYYVRDDADSDPAVGPNATITREERTGDSAVFYKGARGLTLFSALASSELQEAAADGGKASPAELAPADRDEILTSAFLQVFDLARVVKATYEPKSKSIAAVVGSEGNVAADFQYVLSFPSPVPAEGVDEFIKRLETARPVLRFTYAAGALTLKAAEIRVGGKVYRASAVDAATIRLPKAIAALEK